MKNMIEALNWRYATKKYDTTKTLAREQVDMLLEAARLSPSSFGLQPWKFVVVTNPEVRANLRNGPGYGQTPMTDATALIVFCVRTDVDAAYVEKFITTVAETRGMPREALAGYEAMIKGSVAARTANVIDWCTRQVYIALGVLLATAASEGIDATPMEGFDPKGFDEILGLKAMNLESRALAAIGFRAGDDEEATRAKVRFPKSEVIVEVK